MFCLNAPHLAEHGYTALMKFCSKCGATAEQTIPEGPGGPPGVCMDMHGNYNMKFDSHPICCCHQKKIKYKLGMVLRHIPKRKKEIHLGYNYLAATVA